MNQNISRLGEPIQRPPFESVPLETGRAWQGGNFRYEEKLDGVWAVESFQVPGCEFPAVLAGERMRDGSFYAFDALHYAARDLRGWPLRARLEVLDTLERTILKGQFRRPAAGNGGEFLEAVLARGGEGTVAKDLDAPWGATWFKCKRQETFDLIVTEKHAGGMASIRVAELGTRNPEPGTAIEDRGWCPCRREFDRVQVGDVVEVAAFGLTAKGKLREPRFVRVRPDKMMGKADNEH